jgi:hypothetical protein
MQATAVAKIRLSILFCLRGACKEVLPFKKVTALGLSVHRFE